MKDIKNLLGTICLVLGFVFHSWAQQPLKIGDRIPDIMLRGIMGKNHQEIKLSQLRDRDLLLIDFWFTSCVPCLKEMRLLDSLGKKHPEKFRTVMVTYQSEQEIRNFLNWQTNSDLKEADLFLVTGDTVLRKMFPHRSAPHNIWIDRSGTVRAITGTEEVNEDNILSFGKNGTTDMKTKSDNFDFAPEEVFHQGDKNFLTRSIISPYIPGIEEGTTLAAGNAKIGYRRFSAYNSPLIYIYWKAYSGFVSGPRMQLIEAFTTDSLRLFNPQGFPHLYQYSKFTSLEAYKQHYTYNYNLDLFKAVRLEQIRKRIFDDLELQFGIKAEIQLRDTRCMVVSGKPGKHTRRSLRSDTVGSIQKVSGNRVEVVNSKISDILDYIWRGYGHKQVPYPFVAEIAAKDDYRFDLVLDFSNELTASRPNISAAMYYKLLQEVGFRFNEESRKYPKLILHDPG